MAPSNQIWSMVTGMDKPQKMPGQFRIPVDPKAIAHRNIELTETVNIEAAQFLFSMDYQQFKELMDDDSGSDAVAVKKPTQHDIKRNFKVFKRTLASMLSKPEGVKRKYTHGMGRPFGRKYTPLGLGPITRIFRGVLCQGKYTDVDAVNCAFTMIEQLCLQDGVACSYLSAYNGNRPAKLQEVMDHFSCTKAKAKTMFISAAFWHKQRYTGQAFLDGFDAEMKRIQQHFFAKPEYRFLLPYVEKETNRVGAFMSALYQFHEAQMLDACYDLLTVDPRYKDAVQVGVLAFDGLQLYGEHAGNSQLLTDLSDAVHAKTGFRIQFDYKPFDDTIEVPEDFVYEGLQTFDQHAAEFDLTHVKAGDVFVQLRDDGEHEVLSEDQMRKKYRHIGVLNEDGDEVNFIEKWLRNNPNMRVYDRMDVFPNAEEAARHPKVYNMWTPFKMDRDTDPYTKKPEALKLVLEQLFILSGRHEESFAYLQDFIANMIQYPENKSTMPVLIGDPGNGKTWFVKLLRELLGDSKVFECTNPQRDIFGGFNSRMFGAFLVNLSEVGGKDFVDAYNKLKALITDPTLDINQKNIAVKTILSHHHWLTTTNSYNPLPTDDKDRRAAFIRCSDEKIGDTAWFDRLHALLDDRDTLLTVWHYFKTRKCKSQLTKADLPVTEFHEEIKQQNTNPIIQWVHEMIARVPFSSKQPAELQKTLPEAFAAFQRFCDETNQKNYTAHLTRPQFGTRLGQLKLPGVYSKGAKEKGCHVQVKHFEIATLRAHFGIKDVSRAEQAAADKKRKQKEALEASGQRTLEATHPPALERAVQDYLAASSNADTGESKRARAE